jgi:hypothetical protein
MQVPDSVQAYFADGGVRRAVSELLKISRSGEILEGMEWSDLERFYRAEMAARQLESEWAIFALKAWEHVWGGLLGHWTGLSPDEQMAPQHQAGLNLSGLTDNGDGSLWFGRVFTKDSWLFYASLWGVPGTGLQIKISCGKGRRQVTFSELAVTVNENGNWEPDAAVSLTGAGVDLSPLRTVAERACEIADRERSKG